MGHREWVRFSKPAWLALGLVATVGGACIGTSPDFSIAAADPPPRVDPAREVATLAEAVDRLAVGWTGATGDQERLLEALDAVYRSEFARAEGLLTALVGDTEDRDVSAHAALALAKVLTARSMWGALADLFEAHPDLVDRQGMEEADRVLARAFRTLPPEEYEFESHPATAASSVNRFGLPVVEVTANGVEEDFILDTGASLSVLSRSLAEELGARLVGDETGLFHTSTTRMIEAHPAVLDELRLGSLTIRNHPVAVLDDEDLTIRVMGIPLLRVHGIVGWSVFQRVAVEIDYGGDETVFRRPGPEPRAEPNLFWIGYPMVVVTDDNGTPLYLGLDTGAAGTHLNVRAMRLIDATVTDGGQGLRLGAGGGEAVQRRNAHDFAMHLDGWRVSFPEIGVSSGGKGAALAPTDGILGSDVVGDGRLIVDLPSGSLRLVRPR